MGSDRRQHLLNDLNSLSMAEVERLSRAPGDAHNRFGKDMRENEFNTALQEHLAYLQNEREHHQECETRFFRRRVLLLLGVGVASVVWRGLAVPARATGAASYGSHSTSHSPISHSNSHSTSH